MARSAKPSEASGLGKVGWVRILACSRVKALRANQVSRSWAARSKACFSAASNMAAWTSSRIAGRSPRRKAQASSKRSR